MPKATITASMVPGRAWLLTHPPTRSFIEVDLFHDSFITDVDEAHRAAQRWLRKNENDRFDQIHYIIDMIDTGKWGMEYIALDTMDAEELTFHDWSDRGDDDPRQGRFLRGLGRARDR